MKSLHHLFSANKEYSESLDYGSVGETSRVSYQDIYLETEK